MQIAELIARWDLNEGKPYKGSLIDWGAYGGDGKEPPADIGCMCAQGQVLHTIGGWEPERLLNVDQAEADHETAALLNISRAHAILLRQVNDSVDGAPSIVLTDPGKVLGGEWSKLLDFWWHIDQMRGKDWLNVAARDAASVAARVAARDAASDAASYAASYAASEIQGAHIFAAAKRPFYFLPMFGFATPADIPARPADYGVTQ